MKIYRVIEDSDTVLITADELQALRTLARLVRKYEDKVTWYWMDEEEVR